MGLWSRAIEVHRRALQIGEAARRRVLAEHTYERRAEQVVELLGLGQAVR